MASCLLSLLLIIQRGVVAAVDVYDSVFAVAIIAGVAGDRGGCAADDDDDFNTGWLGNFFSYKTVY